MNVSVFFVIVLIIILLAVIRGYNKGILGLFVGVASWIFLFFFLHWATPQIYVRLQENEAFVAEISERVNKKLTEKAEEITIDNVDEKLTKDGLENLGVLLPEGTMEEYEKLMSNVEDFRGVMEQVSDEDMKEQIEAQANHALDEKKQEAVRQATEVITDYIVWGTAGVIALVVGLLVVGFASGLVEFLNKAPVVGGFSRFAGVIFGFLEGILLVWILMFVVSLFTTTEWGEAAVLQIRENPFLLYLYDNNILMELF